VNDDALAGGLFEGFFFPVSGGVIDPAMPCVKDFPRNIKLSVALADWRSSIAP
jgi:hypothetical protein